MWGIKEETKELIRREQNEQAFSRKLLNCQIHETNIVKVGLNEQQKVNRELQGNLEK